MQELTYDRALELAREVVADFGEDYLYPEDHKRVQWVDEPESPGNPLSCVYVHNGAPSCIVGQILHRHGVSVDDLAAEEFDSADPVSYRLARATVEARDFLNEVQNRQDNGKTWGQSLELGIQLVRVYY